MKPIDWNGALAICKGRKIYRLGKSGRYYVVPFADILEGATYLRKCAEEGADKFEVMNNCILYGTSTPTHIYNVPLQSTGCL